MLLFAHFGAQWKGSEKKFVNGKILKCQNVERNIIWRAAMGERKC